MTPDVSRDPGAKTADVDNGVPRGMRFLALIVSSALAARLESDAGPLLSGCGSAERQSFRD